MDKWTELQDTYLTNQPLIWEGRARIPDPDVPPTEAWLFTFKCERKGRGISRKAEMVTLKADSAAELDQLIQDFVEREDVVPIADQRQADYLKFRGEPVELVA